MELEAAKLCFNHLKKSDLKIPVFVSDWHRGIAKWIAKWITAVKYHIYWCSTTTKEGFQKLILAKWK